MKRFSQTLWLLFFASLFGSNSSVDAFENDPAGGAPAPTATDQTDLIRAADLALLGNRYVEAQALLEQIIGNSTGSDQSRARLLWAELLIALGRPAEAVPFLYLLDERERETCRASAAEGMALMLRGDLDAADDRLLPREQQCADDPIFWRSLGRLHLERARASAAVVALNHALSLLPANEALLNDLAVAYIAANEPAEASRILWKLVDGNADQPEMLINLDYANGMMGRIPLRRASDSDPFWSRRLQFAGSGAQSAGRLALAEALLGQAVIVRPRHDAQLWHQYSEISAK